MVTDISERSGVTCECKWVLSKQWGFLPSKFLRHLSKDKEAFFHDRTLEVNEMIRVNEVWFPKKFTEWEYNNTSAKAGYVNMYDSTVSNVEFGSLKQQDLELVFPRGTIVHDQIIGAWRGLPIEMKALD